MRTRQLLFSCLILAGLVIITGACTKTPPGGNMEHGDLGLFNTFCTECHSAEQVLGKDMTVSDWKAVTRKMSQRRFDQLGEGISEEDQDKIIDYLTEEQ
jgi:hypothetical protein